MKTIGYALGLIALAGAEYLCFWILRQNGFSMPASVGITFGLCVTLFLLMGFMFLSRAAPYGRVPEENDLNTVLRQRHAATLVARRPAPPPAEENGYQMPASAIHIPAMAGMSHLQSEAFRDELVKALEEKRGQFHRVLTDSATELARFDYSVLKTLSRNNPASVEGVLIARRIHNALDYRCKEIERFLKSQPAVDPEKGKQLLLGDLEIPEENALTAVFKSPAVAPIKISEVEFQLRVLLKRISRRRSIFRSKDMMDAQMAAEAIGAERDAAAGQTEASEAELPDSALDDAGVRETEIRETELSLPLDIHSEQSLDQEETAVGDDNDADEPSTL